MIRLGVNIDHVATVRQARRAAEPDPIAAAVLALLGGADGITVHLREDRRHIQDRDVRLLRSIVPAGLNLEMACVEEIAALACEIKPDQATLVPERRQELTTEGGLDVMANLAQVQQVVQRLKGAGIRVAIFVDPDIPQIDLCRSLGADAVEIQTARYSEARTAADIENELRSLEQAAAYAREHRLHLHMGHGLTCSNVRPLVRRIAGLEELNIGHSIVSRAVLVGMERAVREMKDAIREARPG
jgi:pyridoxine 5-phosphate synthase